MDHLVARRRLQPARRPAVERRAVSHGDAQHRRGAMSAREALALAPAQRRSLATVLTLGERVTCADARGAGDLRGCSGWDCPPRTSAILPILPGNIASAPLRTAPPARLPLP